MIRVSFFIRDNAMKIKVLTQVLAISLTMLSLPSFASSENEPSVEDKSYILRAMEFHKRSMEEKKAKGATDEEMAFFRTTSAIGIATTFIIKKCSGIESQSNSFKECKTNAKDLVLQLMNDMQKNDKQEESKQTELSE